MLRRSLINLAGNRNNPAFLRIIIFSILKLINVLIIWNLSRGVKMYKINLYKIDERNHRTFFNYLEEKLVYVGNKALEKPWSLIVLSHLQN